MEDNTWGKNAFMKRRGRKDRDFKRDKGWSGKPKVQHEDDKEWEEDIREHQDR